MNLIPGLLIFVIFGSVFGAPQIYRAEFKENENPIIGILAEEVGENHLSTKFHNKYKSFISASYVKFVECGGARVVPIWYAKFI